MKPLTLVSHVSSTATPPEEATSLRETPMGELVRLKAPQDRARLTRQITRMEAQLVTLRAELADAIAVDDALLARDQRTAHGTASASAPRLEKLK